MGDFERRCKPGMVDLESLDAEADISLVRDLIQKHANIHRALGRQGPRNWDRMLSKFVKVMPRDYRRVLLARRKAQSEGREPLWEDAVGGATWVSPTGFWKSSARCRNGGPSRSGSRRLPRDLLALPMNTRCAPRGRAAWTAEFPFAIRAAL